MGTGMIGKRKLATTDYLSQVLGPNTEFRTVVSFYFLNNHLKSQITFPNSLVCHRDKTKTQNYLSPNPSPLNSPKLSETCFVSPCDSGNLCISPFASSPMRCTKTSCLGNIIYDSQSNANITVWEYKRSHGHTRECCHTLCRREIGKTHSILWITNL